MSTPAEFHALCARVLAACKNRPGTSLNWAHSYAKAGMQCESPEAMHAQALYILANLAGWRGPEAREVKAKLKQF